MPAAYIKGMPARAAEEQLVPIAATTLGSDEILVRGGLATFGVAAFVLTHQFDLKAGNGGAIGLSELGAALGVGA